MKLEDQVCTLNHAIQLSNLGIDEKSAFYLRFDSGMRWRLFPEGYFDPEEEHVTVYPAYTVAELGEMLPTGYDTMRLTGNDGTEGWMAYDEKGDDFFSQVYLFETEAEARAAMLIHLLEKKIITANDVNQRLSL